MALAGRTIRPSNRQGGLDGVLAALDDDDAAWLLKHLTATGPTGDPLYPAAAISEALRDEGFRVSASSIVAWRRARRDS